MAAYTVTGDYGTRAETAVFRHLRQALEHLASPGEGRTHLGYWDQAGRGEIDFLLRHRGASLAVEVTTSAPVPEHKIQTFGRALRKLRPPPVRSLLLCLEVTRRVVRIEDLLIEILPLEEFLLQCSEPGRLFPSEG